MDPLEQMIAASYRRSAPIAAGGRWRSASTVLVAALLLSWVMLAAAAQRRPVATDAPKHPRPPSVGAIEERGYFDARARFPKRRPPASPTMPGDSEWP